MSNNAYRYFDEIVKSGKKYKIIYADPPWDYNRFNGVLSSKYNLMSIKDICDLAVSEIAEKDSVLIMWVTMPMLMNIEKICTSWGFTYISTLFVWIKKNKNTNSNFFGQGFYTRSNVEIVIMAKRGKGCKVLDHGIGQMHISTIRKHSQKPDAIRKKIVKLFGNVPRIELFARTRIPGWDVFGDDQKLFDQINLGEIM